MTDVLTESSAKPATQEDEELDINDVFDDLLLVEERLAEESYQRGLEVGTQEGNTEAYHFGYHRGAEIGAELGFYYGVLCAQESCLKGDGSKAELALKELKKEIEEYPRFNDLEVDLLERLLKLRNKYKKLMDVIKQHLETLVGVLKPQLGFLNCHMVEYLTKDHWRTYIPEEVRNEMRTMEDLLEAKEVFWNQFNPDYAGLGKFPALAKHLAETKQYRLDVLPGAAMTVEELKSSFDTCLKETRLRMPELMSVKKRHEVEIASAVVASLCTVVANKADQDALDRVAVIDAGDGKGYLSSRVALEHGIKVLGIDSNEGNTVGAEKRRDKLKKKVRGAVRKSDLAEDEYFANLLQADSPAGVESNYKTTTKLIDFDTNLIELVGAQFPNCTADRFCLAGLHTCGNLGPNCLRLFHQNAHIHALCNVGCCYHLLIEEFIVDEYYNADKAKDNPGIGFPMSEFMRGKRFHLGRNARNLAAESIERAAFNRENPSDKLGFRALLEVVLLQLSAEVDTQVGKLKSTDFVDYCRKGLKRLKVDDSGLSEELLRDMETKFSVELEQLKVFYLFRMTYAPIIEGIILLDRILFLKECGYENSYLVKLFDPVVSPRCYAILAFK